MNRRTAMIGTFLLAVAACGFAAPGNAQTPLARAFQDLRSKDANKVEKTKEEMSAIAAKELPTIEKDTGLICSALKDPDPYIRLQAAAILATIVQIAPQHNQVVQACVPALLVAARDRSTEVRDDALFALAMDPAGPPPQAEPIFRDALNSDYLRTAEVAGAGLLREKGPNAAANQKLVVGALANAPDARCQENLLYAITGSGIRSQALFEAAKRVLFDSNDSGVQQLALEAMVASGASDKAAVATALNNIQSSPSINAITKKTAEGMLKHMR